MSFIAKKIKYDAFLSIVQTEKTYSLKDRNVICIKVVKDANKHLIAKMVEDLFGFKPLSVKTANIPGKEKIFRGKKGFTSGYKKAYVKFEEVKFMDHLYSK